MIIDPFKDKREKPTQGVKIQPFSSATKDPRVPIPPIDSDGTPSEDVPFYKSEEFLLENRPGYAEDKFQESLPVGAKQVYKGMRGVREKMGGRLLSSAEMAKDAVVEGYQFGRSGVEDIIAAATGEPTFDPRTGEFKETPKDVLSRLGQAGLGAAKTITGGAEVVTSPLSAVAGWYKPETEAGIQKVTSQFNPEQKEFLGNYFNEITKNMTPADKDAIRSGLAALDLAEFGQGSAVRKLGSNALDLGKEGVESATDLASNIKRNVKEGLEMSDDFLRARQANATQSKISSITKKIDNNVNNLIDQNVALKRGLKRYQKNTNTDVRQYLKDPEVYNAIAESVEGGSIKVDKAVMLLEDRVEKAMSIKKNLLPIADDLTNNIDKETLKKLAYQSMDDVLPEKQSAIKKAIDKQIDALPDEFNMSYLDNVRAKARTSGRLSSGAMKEASEFIAIERAARDLVFKRLDELGLAPKGTFAKLNTTIKDNLSTMDYLEKVLDGKKVAGGRLGVMQGKVVGAVAGSMGGPFGSIFGSELGGQIQSVIMNSSLRVGMKKKILDEMLSGRPDLLRQAQEMLDLARAQADLVAPSRPMTPVGGTLRLDNAARADIPPPSRTLDFKKGGTPKKLSSQGIKLNKNLSKVDAVVQDKSIQKYLNSKDNLIEEYIGEYGKKINTDDARNLFRDVGYNGTNSAAVHSASSKLSKDVWRKQLKNPEPSVLIFAGGSGTGKTTAARGIVDNLDNTAAMLDGNLSKMSSALERIKEAKVAGKKVDIVYIYRDPVEAFENGVIKRMLGTKETGRVVPSSIHVENHTGSLDVIKKLRNNPDVNIRLIDNTFGKNNARDMVPDKLDTIKMPNDLRKQLQAIAKRYLDQGKITSEQYQALID